VESGTQRVIILDGGVIIHRAINAIPMIMKNKPPGSGLAPWEAPPYLGFSMMLGWLNRVGITPNDMVIIAMDARNAWRKDFETQYKGDRKQKREDSGIDFGKWYDEFDALFAKLDKGTPWHFVYSERCEADDIMAVACRYFRDQEVVLITIDADLEQMWEYPNVKIFTPMTKAWKLKPANFDLNKFQTGKIYKETADNMTAELLTEHDYEMRRKCIDLITLPEWVEANIKNELELLGPKWYDVNLVPYKSLREKFCTLGTDLEKYVSYEAQHLKEQNKLDREKRKKEEAKAKILRAKEREKKKLEKQAEKEAKLLKRIQKLENKKEKELCH
jgi:hypothetical protein